MVCTAHAVQTVEFCLIMSAGTCLSDTDLRQVWERRSFRVHCIPMYRVRARSRTHLTQQLPPLAHEHTTRKHTRTQ